MNEMTHEARDVRDSLISLRCGSLRVLRESIKCNVSIATLGKIIKGDKIQVLDK